MKPTPLSELPESLVLFNRIRYKNELAQGIYDLMRSQRVNRKGLADLLGVNKSRISHMLSGEQNLGAETMAARRAAGQPAGRGALPVHQQEHHRDDRPAHAGDHAERQVGGR